MTTAQINEMVKMTEGNRVIGTYHGGNYSGVISRFTFSDKDSSFAAFVTLDANITGQFGISRLAGETIIIRTNVKHSTIERVN